MSKETYYRVKRDLHVQGSLPRKDESGLHDTSERRDDTESKETYYSQKRPTTESKETYYRVKRDLQVRDAMIQDLILKED